MKNFVVTFARGFGTGGKVIASELAKELGVHCYENRILTLASQLSGLDEKVFKEVNEKLRTSGGGLASLMSGLPRARKYIARNEKFVSDDKLFDYQKQIILNLAETESCVAALTPCIVERLAPALPEKFAKVSRILGGKDEKDCADSIRRFLKAINLDVKLGELGITPDDVDWLTENCMKISVGNLKNAPVTFSKEEVEQIYKEAI